MDVQGETSGSTWTEDPAFSLFRERLTEILYGTDEFSHNPKPTSLTGLQFGFLQHRWLETHPTAKALWRAEATRTSPFDTYASDSSSVDCDFLSPFTLWRDAELSQTSTNDTVASNIVEYDEGMRKLWDEQVIMEVKAYWAAKLWDLKRDAFSREMAKDFLTQTPPDMPGTPCPGRNVSSMYWSTLPFDSTRQYKFYHGPVDQKLEQ